MLGLPGGGYTHMQAHTDVYTLTRTTGISHGLSPLVFMAGTWGLAVNWSRWKEDKKLKRTAEEVVMRNPPVLLEGHICQLCRPWN